MFWFYDLLIVLALLFARTHLFQGALTQFADHELSDHDGCDDMDMDALDSSTMVPKKKGCSCKKDHLHHHPSHLLKFDVMWENGQIVCDETTINLFHN